MYNVGQYVRLHTNDSWNLLPGMIVGLNDEEIEVFCIHNPCWKYYVKSDDADKVIEVVL